MGEIADRLIEVLAHQGDGNAHITPVDGGEQLAVFPREFRHRIVGGAQLCDAQPNVVAEQAVETGDVPAAARLHERDVKVDVVAKAESEKLSTIYVRVGVFGDDALQNRVLDKIKENLAAPATQPSSVQTADAKQ